MFEETKRSASDTPAALQIKEMKQVRGRLGLKGGKKFDSLKKEERGAGKPYVGGGIKVGLLNLQLHRSADT